MDVTGAETLATETVETDAIDALSVVVCLLSGEQLAELAVPRSSTVPRSHNRAVWMLTPVEIQKTEDGC